LRINHISKTGLYIKIFAIIVLAVLGLILVPAQQATAQNPEQNCDNGEDDDNDGFTDWLEDPECLADSGANEEFGPAYSWPTPTPTLGPGPASGSVPGPAPGPNPANPSTGSSGGQPSGIGTMLVTVFIGWVFIIIKGGLAYLINLFGTWIDAVLSINISNWPTVQVSWNVIRNFANMFFIIGLIVMAFGTIFSVAQYDFRKLFGRFLVAVLLINFSLVIGRIIIDWTQSLSNVFLTAIGSIGTRIGSGAILGQRFVSAINGSTAGNDWTPLIASFGDIVLMSIILFSLAVLLVFTLIRIPILWALLIVSPVAWITYILPTTASVSRKWWRYFMGWNVFLPVYLFFIYFGILFLDSTSQNLALEARSVGLFEDMFRYGLIGMFLIGGAKVAMSSSMAAGAGGVAGAIWAKGKATTRFAGTAPFKYAWGTGKYAWGASGAEGAYKEAKEHIQKQGFAGTPLESMSVIGGYRGQRGVEERSAKIAGALGIPGVAERQLGRNVDEAKKRLQEKRVGESELKNIIISTSNDPGMKIAATQRLQEEFGTALSADEVSELIKSLGGTNSEFATKTLRQVKWGEMSTDDLRRFTDRSSPNFISTDRNVESTVLNALIERSRASREEISKAIELARGTAQKTSLIRKSRDYLNDYASDDDRKWLLNELATNPALGTQGEAGNESRVELLKTMAKKGDKFFHDNVGGPVQSELSGYAGMFQNPTELKTFLEEISKKHADNATTEMMNRGLLKDSSGNLVQDTQQALKITLSKLSVDEKLSQNRSQYLRPHFEEALSKDIRRNFSSYINHEKYVAAQPQISGALRLARRDRFREEYLLPFNDQARRLRDRLRELKDKPPTSQALGQIKRQLQDTMLRKLTTLRDNYEDFCIKSNLMASPIDKAEISGDLSSADSIIKRLTDQIANLKNSSA